MILWEKKAHLLTHLGKFADSFILMLLWSLQQKRSWWQSMWHIVPAIEQVIVTECMNVAI